MQSSPLSQSKGVSDIPLLVFLHLHSNVGLGSTFKLTNHIVVMEKTGKQFFFILKSILEPMISILSVFFINLHNTINMLSS